MSVPETNPPTDRMTELQSKLYQAAKRDPHRRFHALYDKLALAYVLESAWQSVRQNDGAPGIDQQTLEQIEAEGVPEFLAGIARALREKTYRPEPVRRVPIDKGGGKTRLLGIPTVRDRVVQAAAKLLLEPIFEADFEGTPSFGFRPGLGQQEALAAIQQHARRGFRHVVDADIEQFFDTLDHQRLMAMLRQRISDGEMLRLIYRWLRVGYTLDGRHYPTDQGTPQGGVISPLLANVYLHEFDRQFQQQKSFVGRLVRYADDFVIQCGNAEHAARARAWAEATLRGLGLRLHPDKTRVLEDREGFDFLGFHHRRVRLRLGRKDSYGVLRWPSTKACKRFRERVRWLLGSPGYLDKHWKEVRPRLIRFLGGWCHYFRHGQSYQAFAKLDRWVQERVARHIARSQPQTRKRRRRQWTVYLAWLQEKKVIPKLNDLKRAPQRAYRGRANVRWRAV